MTACELGRHRFPHRDVKLYWACKDCVNRVRGVITDDHTTVEVERRRQIAPYVMPIARLLAGVALISEILAYWH